MAEGKDRLAAACFAIGGVGLFAAMAVDFLSVVGRHSGLPFAGSIEIVQVCVVIATSAALVGATLAGTHAAVHVITERLPPGPRLVLARLAALLSTLFFSGLAVGGFWLLSDTLPGDERTDLLHLPLGPLRILWCSACSVAALLFLIQVFRPKLAESVLEP
ncbi:hypothetical protein BH11PSE1_BH11PSE1_09620 [soil metagenome]